MSGIWVTVMARLFFLWGILGQKETKPPERMGVRSTSESGSRSSGNAGFRKCSGRRKIKYRLLDDERTLIRNAATTEPGNNRNSEFLRIARFAELRFAVRFAKASDTPSLNTGL